MDADEGCGRHIDASAAGERKDAKGEVDGSSLALPPETEYLIAFEVQTAIGGSWRFLDVSD